MFNKKVQKAFATIAKEIDNSELSDQEIIRLKGLLNNVKARMGVTR